MGTPFVPGTAASLSTRVELTVRCESLPNRDFASRSDPQCILLQKVNSGSDSWMELDRSEVIMDTLDPRWAKKFVLDYRFEERQVLRFLVMDIDSDTPLQLDNMMDRHDFLGSLDIALGEIVSSQSKGFSQKLSGTKKSQIFINCEEMIESKEEVFFRIMGRKLAKKDFFGKSDPYLEIFRTTESGDMVLVYRSEVIKNTLDPNWKEFNMSVSRLCNCDKDRSLKFSVWDWNMSGVPDYIGSFQTSLATIQRGEKKFELVNEKSKKKGGKLSGTIFFDKVLVEVVPSFLDYIVGGTQMNFTVAVDFTGSNGNPKNPSSLHYRSPTGQPNQYVTAIQAVGEIIQDYDSDKQYPCLGFGARIPPDGRVSHEFFLNLDAQNPFCSGIEGILAAYHTSLQNVQLYGPTNFSPVIRHVSQFATVYKNDPTNYFVLLIITDGIISDMADTKRAIIEASRLPLSIIIVGVGEEDFSAMEELDSDDRILSHCGVSAVRDIVQFVEMRRFLTQSRQWDGRSWSKELLAKAVLAEVPGQVSSWMRKNGFQPMQPKQTA